MIELTDVSFGFNGSDQLFSDLNLPINTSEITVISGANGCGKTTFCRLLMGFLRNYTGVIKLNDLDLTSTSTPEIAEFITYLKQEPADNVVAATAREDLAIWQQRFRYEPEAESLSAAINYFELTPLADQPVWELSSGQLKRIGLAALLLNRNKFWILDEPTAGLDAQLVAKLITLISEQKQRKKGVLVVSHRIEVFKAIADRILEIKNNRMIQI